MNDPMDPEAPRALRGRLPGDAGRGPRRVRAGRVCADEACRTVLSVYNAGDRCWEHTQPTPYLLNVRRFRTARMSA
jgi:hypothetical protein